MCRAPTVLKADRCEVFTQFHRFVRLTEKMYIANIDWALVNFMKDWFPVESKVKLKNNEKEVAEEQLQEMGLDAGGCVIA